MTPTQIRKAIINNRNAFAMDIRHIFNSYDNVLDVVPKITEMVKYVKKELNKNDDEVGVSWEPDPESWSASSIWIHIYFESVSDSEIIKPASDFDESFRDEFGENFIVVGLMPEFSMENFEIRDNI